MTTEQKAEAYDRDKEKIVLRFGSNVAEEIFSEFDESEDEKIISAIRKAIEAKVENLGNGVTRTACLAWLEQQSNKDKLIQELGEYKVKYTQEVLGKHISNKDDERLRRTTIDFLKEFAAKGYENAVECIDWLRKQGEHIDEEKVLIGARNIK